MKKIKFIFLLHIISYSCFAQNQSELRVYEDSILYYFNKILNYKTDSKAISYSAQTIKVVNKSVITTDSAKLAYSNKISDLFGEALNRPNSFQYPFSNLKYVSNLHSSDSLVRIITWNIPLQNGTYKYFGYLQKIDAKNDKTLSFRLIDKSEKIKKPEFAKLKPQKWYGALYYKIFTHTFEGKKYYTLLAWDGNNQFSNKKLIECLTFSKNRPIFGEPIFRMKHDMQNRIIFEYAKPVGMMLRYDENFKMIVYDHLSPENGKFTGQYMYYGPDMSHDGIRFIRGNWVLQENLNLQNKTKVKVKELPKSF